MNAHCPNEDGLLLKSSAKEQMIREETYKQMATEYEDWSDFEEAAGDGIKGTSIIGPGGIHSTY